RTGCECVDHQAVAGTAAEITPSAHGLKIPEEPGRGPLAKILASTPARADRPPLQKPEREFFVLFTARTGSSHLAELLTAAGVGDVREWLNPAFIEAQAKYFGAASFADYFAGMRSICPKGVFGQKMTIWFHEAFSREARLEDHFDFSAPCVLLFRE